MRSDEEDELLGEDKGQDEIRAELSQMSFEKLQKLKEKLGTKVYNEAIFGPQKRKKVIFQRESKNRPREMSSKKQVSQFRAVVPVKKNIIRDPRFDSLCGTFNEKIFKRSYGFLNKMKENDLEALRTELKGETDPKERKKIKYLIQRLENQLREETKHQQMKEKKEIEKKEIIQAIKRGEKPVFKKKSEQKILDLVAQFDELKKAGRLKKHIQRLRKKNKHKDRVKLDGTAVD